MNDVPEVTVKCEGAVGGDDLLSLVAQFAPAFVGQTPVKLRFDLREATFVTPAVLAAVRCAVKELKRRGLLAEGSGAHWPDDPGVRRYLQRMDVFQGVAAIEIVEDFKRHDEKGFVPVAEFSDTDGAASTARRLVETLQLADDPNVTGNLEIALAELAENVIFHSGENYGVASAQHWRRRDTVEMAIVDMGRGIPAGLRQNPAHTGLSDSEALRNSVELLVSGVEDPARGKGLWITSQYVERNAGRLEDLLRRPPPPASRCRQTSGTDRFAVAWHDRVGTAVSELSVRHHRRLRPIFPAGR